MSRLGLQDFRRTFLDWRRQSSSTKRVLVEISPSESLASWSPVSTGVYSAAVARYWSGALLAVTGVRCSLHPYRLVRVESLVECQATESTFFFDPEQAYSMDPALWDDGETSWDGPVVIWDVNPTLFVHMPGGVSPATATTVAEFLFTFAAQGVVLPDLGPEKFLNGVFEAFTGDVPDGWTVLADGGVSVQYGPEDADVSEGTLSFRMESLGGSPGTWDDGVSTWDSSVLWDLAPNPSLIAEQEVPVVSGSRYRISGDRKDEVANEVEFRAYLRILGPSGTEALAADGFSTVAAASGWHLLTLTRGEWRNLLFEFVSPWSGDVKIQIRGWNSDDGSCPAGIIYWDGFRFRKVWRQIFASPAISDSGVPGVSQQSRDVYFGGKTVGGGSISLINDSGAFEQLLSLLNWIGAEVKEYAGGDFPDGEALSREQYEAVFSGIVGEDPRLEDSRLNLDVLDNLELLNIQIPEAVYSRSEFGDILESWEGEPRPLFFGTKTNISPVPVAFNGDYRIYEVAYCGGSPVGIKAVTAVYAYYNSAAADAQVVVDRITLTSGVDYSVVLTTGMLTILKDVRLLEVPEDKNLLDFQEAGGALVATLTPGLYTPSQLATHVQTQMRAVGSANLTAVYSEVTHLVTLGTSVGGTLSLLRSTGANRDQGVWALLGWGSGGDLTGSTSYVGETPLLEDADTQHVVRVDAQGLKDDATGTYTGTASALITKAPDVLRYLLSVVLERPEMVHDVSFDKARVDAPEALSLYLNTQENLRQILDRIEYSVGADIVFGADGFCYITVATDEVPPNPIRLYDPDYLQWSMGPSARDLASSVTLLYDQDPTTGKWKTWSEENPTVKAEYRKASPRSFETYLTEPSDVSARGAEIRVLSSQPPLVVELEVKGKLAAARIGTKVLITRSRAVSLTGSLASVLFRVLGISTEPLGARTQSRLVEVD